MIRIFVTGGTFDKTYDEIRGRLSFGETHLPPRIKRADRKQRRLLPVSLDEMVAEDHQVRAVWAYVEEMDLSALYERYRAVEGRAGRSAIDPQILFALWIYATLDGVGRSEQPDQAAGPDHPDGRGRRGRGSSSRR